MIPRTAHFIWFGEPPDWLSKVLREFGELHPGWTVHLHTKFPTDTPDAIRRRVLPCGQLCQAADILAAWLLYSQGGIYFDTDAIALRSFEPLLDLDAFTSPHNDSDKRLTNGLMGSARHGEAFTAVVEWIKASEPITKRGIVRRCFYGPDMLTEMFARGSYPGMTVLPWHYFYPYTFDERLKAHACWQAPLADRPGIVGDHAWARFVDGVPPYAIHLWGIEGSSHREVSNVSDLFDREPATGFVDPAGKAPDLPVDGSASQAYMPVRTDPGRGDRRQKGRAGQPAPAERFRDRAAAR